MNHLPPSSAIDAPGKPIVRPLPLRRDDYHGVGEIAPSTPTMTDAYDRIPSRHPRHHQQNRPHRSRRPSVWREHRPDAKTGKSRQNHPSTYHYDQAPVRVWLSRDPIGERGGVNLYGMVGNDVINSTDRLGLKSFDFFVVGIDIQEEGDEEEDSSTKSKRAAGRALGIDHVDLWYGQEDGAIEIITGFALRTPKLKETLTKLNPADPDHLDTHFPGQLTDISDRDFIKKLDRVYDDDKELRWGDFSGISCLCVDDWKRLNCLISSPQPKAEHRILDNNCQTDIERSVKGCCLEGYDALGPHGGADYFYKSKEERDRIDHEFDTDPTNWGH